MASLCPAASRICRTWTHSESLQPRGSGIAHEDSRTGLESQGLRGPPEGDLAMLLAVHDQGHFLTLDGHGKAVPPVGHHRHREGSRFVGHSGAGLRVVEDDPLVAVLHAREPQAQVDDLLQGIRDGEEHTSLGAAGLRRDADGKVTEEGGGDEGPGRAAHVGARPKAVGREAAVACDEGHGRGQRDTDELGEVQMAPGSRICRERERPCFTRILCCAWE